MSEIHGRLLIGGMTLKDVAGVVELRTDCPCAEWCGHLLIDPSQGKHLEPARVYRLELDDGRSGQIVITRVEHLPGSEKRRVYFDGKSALVAPRFEQEREPAEMDAQEASLA